MVPKLAFFVEVILIKRLCTCLAYTMSWESARVAHDMVISAFHRLPSILETCSCCCCCCFVGLLTVLGYRFYLGQPMIYRHPSSVSHSPTPQLELDPSILCTNIVAFLDRKNRPLVGTCEGASYCCCPACAVAAVAAVRSPRWNCTVQCSTPRPSGVMDGPLRYQCSAQYRRASAPAV